MLPCTKETTGNGGAAAAAPPELSAGQERLVFGAAVLWGYKVEVLVKSGVLWEGIFYTANFQERGEMSVVLKCARVVRDPNAHSNAPVELPLKQKVFHNADLVQVYAKDVRFTPEDLAPDEEFETDAAISRGRGGAAGRDLQRWEPDEGDDFTASTLEGDGSAAWDQFAVNKAKFGVETTYDENVYTVALNRGNCAITEAEAARLAREIETAGAGSGMAKLHMLEERGLEVADEVNHPAVAACEADASCCSADDQANPVDTIVPQMNEEDRYGAVLRPELGGYQGNAGRGRPAYPNQYARATPNPNPPNSQGRAWGGAGAGVAAVAGRQAFGPGGHHPMGPQASHAAAGPRARQDYDQRLEQHKDRERLTTLPAQVRGGMHGHKMPAVSQDVRALAGLTGGRPHPTTNLSQDGKALMALDLQLPGPKSYGPEVTQEFVSFKRKQTQEKVQQEQAQRLQELIAAKATGAAAMSSASSGLVPSTLVSAASGASSLASASSAAALAAGLARSPAGAGAAWAAPSAAASTPGAQPAAGPGPLQPGSAEQAVATGSTAGVKTPQAGRPAAASVSTAAASTAIAAALEGAAPQAVAAGVGEPASAEGSSAAGAPPGASLSATGPEVPAAAAAAGGQSAGSSSSHAEHGSTGGEANAAAASSGTEAGAGHGSDSSSVQKKPAALNPNAKAFSFKVTAKPFVPGGPSTATAAAAATGGGASTATPTPAAGAAATPGMVTSMPLVPLVLPSTASFVPGAAKLPVVNLAASVPVPVPGHAHVPTASMLQPHPVPGQRMISIPHASLAPTGSGQHMVPLGPMLVPVGEQQPAAGHIAQAVKAGQQGNMVPMEGPHAMGPAQHHVNMGNKQTVPIVGFAAAGPPGGLAVGSMGGMIAVDMHGMGGHTGGYGQPISQHSQMSSARGMEQHNMGGQVHSLVATGPMQHLNGNSGGPGMHAMQTFVPHMHGQYLQPMGPMLTQNIPMMQGGPMMQGSGQVVFASSGHLRPGMTHHMVPMQQQQQQQPQQFMQQLPQQQQQQYMQPVMQQSGGPRGSFPMASYPPQGYMVQGSGMGLTAMGSGPQGTMVMTSGMQGMQHHGSNEGPGLHGMGSGGPHGPHGGKGQGAGRSMGPRQGPRGGDSHADSSGSGGGEAGHKQPPPPPH
ncbi:hypothetical protein QJQ45_022529 [Haematococcus lacustris]|nr:hypothetical protein QJQ45_022529 [Haematococcus lacustris]